MESATRGAEAVHSTSAHALCKIPNPTPMPLLSQSHVFCSQDGIIPVDPSNDVGDGGGISGGVCLLTQATDPTSHTSVRCDLYPPCLALSPRNSYGSPPLLLCSLFEPPLEFKKTLPHPISSLWGELLGKVRIVEGEAWLDKGTIYLQYWVQRPLDIRIYPAHSVCEHLY